MNKILKYKQTFSYRSQFFSCMCLPNANVHLIGSTEQIFVIQTPSNTCDVLLTLCVINFTRIRFFYFINSDRLVITARHKFFSCWRVIDTCDCCHMIFMDSLWAVHIAGIKCVQTKSDFMIRTQWLKNGF